MIERRIVNRSWGWIGGRRGRGGKKEDREDLNRIGRGKGG